MSSSPRAVPWVVLKFGGTSVSSRVRWDNIGRISADRAREARVLVVVSALAGVTNELQAIAQGDADAAARVEALDQRHRAFARELGLDDEAVLGARLAALQALIDDERATHRPYDWQAEVLSQGELLSSTLGAAYLAAQGHDFGWCDARDWLRAIDMPNQSDWARRLSVNCERSSDDAWREVYAGAPSR